MRVKDVEFQVNRMRENQQVLIHKKTSAATNNYKQNQLNIPHLSPPKRYWLELI